MLKTQLLNLAVEQITEQILGLQKLGLSPEEIVMTSQVAVAEVERKVSAEYARRELESLQKTVSDEPSGPM